MSLFISTSPESTFHMNIYCYQLFLHVTPSLSCLSAHSRIVSNMCTKFGWNCSGVPEWWWNLHRCLFNFFIILNVYKFSFHYNGFILSRFWESSANSSIAVKNRINLIGVHKSTVVCPQQEYFKGKKLQVIHTTLLEKYQTFFCKILVDFNEATLNLYTYVCISWWQATFEWDSV